MSVCIRVCLFKTLCVQLRERVCASAFLYGVIYRFVRVIIFIYLCVNVYQCVYIRLVLYVGL